MKVTSVSCSNCGAPVNLPEDIEQFSCAYCGALMIVQRGDGYVSLKLAEKMSEAIKETSNQTQSTIREGAQVTQAELKRLQISQEISSLQIQLANLQAEIRALERQKSSSKIKNQLKQLHNQELQLIYQIRTLQSAIQSSWKTSPEVGGRAGSNPLGGSVPTSTHPPKDWSVTFWLCLLFGWLGIHRFYTGHFVIGLLQLVTLGGFFIWWMIDLVLISTQKYRDVHGNLLTNANVRLGRSCVASLFTYIGVSFLLMMVVVPLEEAIRGSSGSLSGSVPMAGLVIGILVFLYRMTPDAALWKPIRDLFFRKKKASQSPSDELTDNA